MRPLFLFCLLLGASAACGAEPPFRPPSVPLVAHDPYLSIWSNTDKLTDDNTRHWTRREHSLSSLIRIDGKSFRLMGKRPDYAPPLNQTGLRVLPTRTIYDFEQAGVHVTLTFLTPALPTDLDVLARPLTYLTWTVRAVDGQLHDVAIFSGTSSQLAVNLPEQKVAWNREAAGSLTALRVGSENQTILKPAGDDVRINWGYAYAAASSADSSACIGGSDALMGSFAQSGKLPDNDEPSYSRATADGNQPVLAFAFDLGRIGNQPVSRRVMVAYDELFAINFLGEKLRPYWRRNGMSPADLLQKADAEYDDLAKRCEAFDRQLMEDATRLGGARYAQLVALSHRQGLAGCGFAADSAGQPMIFTKENTSNGCIATTDLVFPAAPQFLLFGPALAKAIVAPILVYTQSPQWKLPFAPHDLGVYPQATGQVYGGGEHPVHYEDMMPVEESGNMLILCDAICQMDGNAEFVSRWWPQLTAWEKYLEKFGYDPENQLCTDDFMGHLAHNANLSVKAIVAIAAYGDMCRYRGDRAAAEKYSELAKQYAEHWMQVADDGDHYRLAFDKPNSWSQKYNLVWDLLLNLDVFPSSVAQKEIAHYKKQRKPYGVPLDSRTKITKSDWSVWSATLADNQADFESIVSPIYDYLHQTKGRVAFADSYITDDIKSDGMHARPVIGGVFIKMLSDPTVWRSYYAAGPKVENRWAAAPSALQTTPIVATSQRDPALWRYTFDKPAEDWSKPEFDDSGWKEGAAGFGSAGTPGSNMRTLWTTADIWMRRQVTLPEGEINNPALLLHHDEDAEVYFNGILAAQESGYVDRYELTDISHVEAAAVLKPGAKVTLAVHCHQTMGGQYIDVGIVNVKPNAKSK